jgi:hypothetical protein
MNKQIHIFGGGTLNFVSNHLALCAPAYGTTADTLQNKCKTTFPGLDIVMHKTKMAGGKVLESNDDIRDKVKEIVENPLTKIVFFSCALADYKPIQALCSKKNALTNHGEGIHQGKYGERIETSKYPILKLSAIVSQKIIKNIRTEKRKDIFLVGFKTTCGATKQEMFEKGLALCKDSSANLVLVNDTKNRFNMIVTPEEASYHETEDRDEALSKLIEMTYLRSHLTFTRSTVIEGDRVSWADDRVPNSLREAVNHCIKGNAYKPFKGSTVGHFATKISDSEFLTSIRKSNFNDLSKNGLVYVKTDGPDTVLAYGAKPSVGGQSQRIIFKDHSGYDCVLHFHCPLKADHKDSIPVVSQREVECGSHECGKNTSDNLKRFGNLKCVMLDKHGPNIIFPKNIQAREVIKFIDDNFDLGLKTGGYNLTTQHN